MSDHTLQRMQGAMVTVLGVLLTVFFLSGCVAQNKETTKPSESETQMTDAGQNETVAGRQLQSVVLDQEDGNFKVLINADKKLTYTSIKQDFPFGIAIYLPDTLISESFQKTIAKNNSISDILVGYAGEDKSTVKVEILLKENLGYEIADNQNTLVVALNGGTSEPSSTEQVAAKEDIQPRQEDEGSGQSQELIIPDKTATMENIEFNTMEDGNSDIVVKTDHPVKYDISQKGYDTIYLNLYNTVIPEYHKRPLLTKYFKSAVESLIPIQIPGKEKKSAIEIKIRQAVPYRVVQNKNQISLFFEPSTIAPPVFEKATKKLNGETTIETGSAAMQPAGSSQMMSKSNMTNSAQVSRQPENSAGTDDESFIIKKHYTGEKIKLDFYETDIKNVFRILKSVGGLNFAIDKDVEGKVTLALEDPVPWDQVLDLILKMNDLGQKREGNVIRIAKLSKLKKEEQLIQEAIAARKKTIADNKALEPLVTEYIPINYSDADTDIKPHIEKILTKDRGKISVDSRTNMIILTDTQEKIDQAKEIIYRLDKVTPQIMIEAKVVEVTKDFSRELGMGLQFNRTQTAPTGNSEDFSVALNYPTSSPGTDLSFNFYRLLGAQFLNLKAQLAASESKGDIKVVSSPRILTLDNKKAKIKQGLEYAYLERDDSGGSSVKFKNIDLLLEVTPHVTPDKRIAMTVYLTKNDIDTVTNGVPSLSTNEAETELLVNNNDTVVIGGIVKTTDNKSTSGTPVLSGIPIIGRLFRTDIDKDKRNELLIFLTPSIVQLEQKKNTFTAN